MAYYSDGYGNSSSSNSLGLDLLNIFLTLTIIGVLFYLFIKYNEFQKKVQTTFDTYKKKIPTNNSK